MNCLHIIEKYYKKDELLYDILLKHSVSVSDKALKIAKKCCLNVDLRFVEQAAMLHDIGVFLTYAPSISCFGKHKYIEHGYLGADILRKEGYFRHALVCERHIGTGISLVGIVDKNLPLPHRDMMPISLEEQLICYADLFFSKSRLNEEIPINEVRTKVALWGEKSVSQFEKWNEIFLS